MKHGQTIYDFRDGIRDRTVVVTDGTNTWRINRDETLADIMSWVVKEGYNLEKNYEQGTQFVTISNKKQESFSLQHSITDTEMKIKINRMEKAIADKKKLKIGNITFPNGLKKVISTVALGAVLTGGFIGAVYGLGEAVDNNYRIQQEQSMDEQGVYIPTAEEIEAGKIEYEQEIKQR